MSGAVAEEQHKPQAIGHIRAPVRFTRGLGMDDLPTPRTKPKRETAPVIIMS